MNKFYYCRKYLKLHKKFLKCLNLHETKIFSFKITIRFLIKSHFENQQQ